MRTGGLDRRVSAFPPAEQTHAPAVSNLYRAILRGFCYLCRVVLGSTGWEYPPSFRSFKEGEERETVMYGVTVEVFKVFFLDGVLQRFVEQVVEDGIFVGKTGFNNASWSRTSMRGSGGAVLRRGDAFDRISHIST